MDGLLRGFAGEGEHLGDVLDDVLVADKLVLVSGAGVVVALGKAETALADAGDLLGGVFEVLLLAVAEEDADAVALEFAGEVGKAGLGDVVDGVKQGLDGGEVLLGSMSVGVHAGGVVVADFLLVGGAGGVCGGVLFEDAAELLGVDVVEGLKLVDTGLVGGDRVDGAVVAAGELIEVGAGVGLGVHGGLVEHGGREVMGFWGRSGSRGRGLGLKMEAETGGGQGDERKTMLS